MRKFIFFILAATTFAIVINAQIRVKKYGQLQVGQKVQTSAPFPPTGKTQSLEYKYSALVETWGKEPESLSETLL